MGAIREVIALLLCATIRLENRRKWYTPAGLQCLICMRFSKGDPAKMCLTRQEGYRGCRLVNRRYTKIYSARD